ncbi:hypothetical protein M2168_005221 [Streptomyces sp. CZ24]|nr:hypothetical protein [Streptomyces sp. CZ24]
MGGGVLEPPLAAVQAPARVDRDQPAGGVQDVGGRAGAGVGVADGVGEDGGDALVGGEADGAGGEAERAGAGAAQPVVDGLQAERVAVHLAPGGEEPRGPVGAAGGEGAADVGGGAEQDGDALAVVLPPGQQGLVGAGRVGGGDQAAEGGPAGGAVPGEVGDAGGGLVDEGAAAHRDPALRAGAFADGEFDAEEGPDPGGGGGLGEADGSGEGVPVGEGDGVHAAFGGALGELPRVRGAVPQGVPRDGVQMREPHRAHLRNLVFHSPPPSTIDQVSNIRTITVRGLPRPARGPP